MQRTLTVDGRVYRVVDLPAADTHGASQHISAERPLGFTASREIREGRRSL